MINTNMPQNCMIFLLPCRLTRLAIYGSQIFYSHKWPTVLVRKAKGKPHNFEANSCGSLYSTFKTSFQPYMHFITNGYKCFLHRQLVRSKATCPFKWSSLFIAMMYRFKTSIKYCCLHVDNMKR